MQTPRFGKHKTTQDGLNKCNIAPRPPPPSPLACAKSITPHRQPKCTTKRIEGRLIPDPNALIATITLFRPTIQSSKSASFPGWSDQYMAIPVDSDNSLQPSTDLENATTFSSPVRGNPITNVAFGFSDADKLSNRNTRILSQCSFHIHPFLSNFINLDSSASHPRSSFVRTPECIVSGPCVQTPS